VRAQPLDARARALTRDGGGSGQVGPNLFLAMGLGPQGIERGPALAASLALLIASSSQDSAALLRPVDPRRPGSGLKQVRGGQALSS